MRHLFQRMLGAALLRSDTYEEVEADRSATGQAFLVVLLSAAAAGVGTIENHGAAGILWSSLAELGGWLVWAWVTCVVGTRLLPGEHTESDLGELLRTIGFSRAPGLLRLLGVISPLTGIVFVVCSVWMLVAMVVAVRQALDYESTLRAVAVCAIGFPVYAIILALSILLQGPWPI
jgi:hypothetical protein